MLAAVSTLAAAILLFSPQLDLAFRSLDLGDDESAARYLDEAASIEPEYFERNNMPYLRGRIAERLGDWARADKEFARIGSGSSLFRMALWHRARAAIARGRDDEAIGFLDRLPSAFPAGLRAELAALASDRVAIAIYESLGTREAEGRLAIRRDDVPAMWQLLGRSRADDIALEIAAALHHRDAGPTPAGTMDLTPERRMLLARTFHGHRVFPTAATLYDSLVSDAEFGAEARYELGRTYFQRNLYDEAIEVFGETARLFPGTDWEQDAETQIAAAHWRKMDFPAAERAYLELIGKYEDDFHSSVRDLVDIYRSMGRTSDALSWIDRGLERRPPWSSRAVLTFSRAKILYHAGGFVQALADFAQLRGMLLPSAPNGTNLAEVRFLEALTLDRLGRSQEADAIWTELAGEPFTYYGLQSLARLEDDIAGSDMDGAKRLQERVWSAMEAGSIGLCRRGSDVSTLAAVRERNLNRTRSFRAEAGAEADLVGELLFLRQWKEAYYWANIAPSRWRDDAMADMAYLAGEYRSAMLYTDRVRPPSDEDFNSDGGQDNDPDRTLTAMRYPAAFADHLCREAGQAGVDPLWLRAIIHQESRYDPSARSSATARGLMQFIPETADEVSLRLNMGPMTPDRMYEPGVSIRLGAHYWAELIDEFGNAEFALAGYNGGPQNVRRWKAKMPVDDPALFVAEIGFVQTKDYVSRIFGLYARYLHLQ